MRIKTFMEQQPLFATERKFMYLLERKATSIILGITCEFMSERKYKEYSVGNFHKSRETTVL